MAVAPANFTPYLGGGSGILNHESPLKKVKKVKES